MSLLLDALKEAQKQRNNAPDLSRSEPDNNVVEESPVEASAVEQGIVEDELELELELELDLETDSSPGAEGGEPTQIATSEPSPENSPKNEAQEIADSSNMHSLHSANAVFRNRRGGKSKRPLVIASTVLCLVLLSFVSYVFFFTESSPPPSIKPQVKQSPGQTAENGNTQPFANTGSKTQNTEVKTKVNKVVASAVVTTAAKIEPLRMSGVGKKDALGGHESVQPGARAVGITGGLSDGEVEKTVVAKKNLLALQSPVIVNPAIGQPSNKNAEKTSVKANIGADQRAELTGIHIRKRRIPAKRNKNLELAQKSLFRGDVDSAEHGFTGVLAASPKNITALMGMASIAQLKGQNDWAQLYYQRVLAENPQHLRARVGVLNLTNSLSLEVGSALKQLIQENPEQTFLYASLGDYYLKRAEWHAAQKAYFTAFSRDSMNADYAYNLGICLDQMAKAKLAMDFYRQALELSHTSSASFDAVVLEARIAVLTGTLQ